MSYPQLAIDCSKIYHNTKALIHRLGLKNIMVIPVTKICLGHPIIAQVLINAGATILADSRVENIGKMRRAGITQPIMLIRSPMISQVTEVIQYCSISLNTELSVIQGLSCAANKLGVIHDIIIMVELGDLREGLMTEDLMAFIEKIIFLPNIILKGIGTNLACRYGISPDNTNMSQLSDLADAIEKKFDIQLDIISGGNSATLNWAFNNVSKTRVNQLRLGEAVFLGTEALHQDKIEGLFCDFITLTAEVIESKIKPSLPWGQQALNAFGETPKTCDRGDVSQAILALGRQDVSIAGLKPPNGVTIVSSTSDHLVVETSKILEVGEKIEFHLTYGGILFAMTSPFVDKLFLKY
ncbi:alanine/ornithine racemase family PLP-dependent enzyme [uncultured Shewanella sp.]|uniref:alanine/ornithine racemase family PLP-dependent enzyme n=1 Tax=uncultured Shewanella sp. TaxID=173975 RepID=UPI0026108AAC|nr:alanine/ornithine racemase family PLP-dependent enzyme [uncultured Shewanella sp.]